MVYINPLVNNTMWRIIMQSKLIVTFERLSEADFQVKAGFIIASLTNNPNFPEPWPDIAPSLAQINGAFGVYKDYYHASLTGDTVKIGLRKDARNQLTNLLKRLTAYLEFVAQQDPAMLASTGYDQRKEPVRANHDAPLTAPTDFRIAHGVNSGTLDIHVARLEGAKSYEAEIAQGDPSVEANWKHATISATSSHILLEGLTPGSSVWIRVRGIRSGGKGVWTDPINVIVI
jgi:hypothetical protein